MGGHSFLNNNPAALNQSCGSRPPQHGSRGKVDRKISSSPADHTRVPYSHQNHHYHYQRHTGHPRAPQHNQSLHLEEKDSRSYHHKQSTVRITRLNSMKKNLYFSVHPCLPCFHQYKAPKQKESRNGPNLIEHLWVMQNKSSSMETSSHSPFHSKPPTPWYHSTPPEVLFPCISESEQSLIHSGVFMDQTCSGTSHRCSNGLGSWEFQFLESFLRFLGPFLSSFCYFAIG